MRSPRKAGWPIAALCIGFGVLATAITASGQRPAPAQGLFEEENVVWLAPPAADEAEVAELLGQHDDGALQDEEVIDVLVDAGVLARQSDGMVMPQVWDRVPDFLLESVEEDPHEEHAAPPERAAPEAAPKAEAPPAPKTTPKPAPAPKEPPRMASPPAPSWSWPVQKGVISSEFGRRGSRQHKGMDIAARTGEPIYAASAGTVIYAGNGMRGYGNALIVHHGGATTTLYAHAHKLGVRKGQRVQRGSRIATVGSTGRSTGPHLHFEVRVGSKAIDPRKVLPESR